MKRYLLLTGFSLAVTFLLAQAPQAINYQAVLRGSDNGILANQDVSLRISILEGNINGTEVYKETHSTSTNQYGIVNLAIGTGTVLTGIFNNIAWGSSNHYIKIEADTAGGTNYYDMGTTQLLSVPYALESKHSSSLTLTDENGNKYEVKVDTNGSLLVEPILGQPCPEIPTVTYEGQTYNTVLIGDQCWLRDNLNVGTKINSQSGEYQQTDNGMIEKYCYNNDEANCAIYGGLYEWPEAMQYLTTEGAQGICPAGWHIPTDNEWKILEGTVDSQYGVGDLEWDQTGWRGYDAGGNLKEVGTTHWNSPNTGATNASGFTGLPGGGYGGYFDGVGGSGYCWTSSEYDYECAWYRSLIYLSPEVGRYIYGKAFGFSVRCLKDN